VRKTVNEIEQLERTLDKESITFKELKEGILKYKAKSEYQQAAIIIIRGVLEKRLHENSGLHKHIVNCFKTDGEQLIKTLGFELDHSYDHDHFHTNRYRKGLLMVEFTYEGFTLKTIDLTMDEVFCKPITYAELKAITPILGEIPT